MLQGIIFSFINYYSDLPILHCLYIVRCIIVDLVILFSLSLKQNYYYYDI